MARRFRPRPASGPTGTLRGASSGRGGGNPGGTHEGAQHRHREHKQEHKHRSKRQGGRVIASERSQQADVSIEEELAPIKVRVEGTCPECGAEDLRTYPVLTAEGWFEVVKCQVCLASVSRVRWHRLGFVHLPEDAL